MAFNGSTKRLSRSPTIFPLCDISQLRSRRNGDAWQDDYQQVPYSSQTDGGSEITAQRSSSKAETRPKSPGNSNVVPMKLTSLNDSSTYSAEKQIDCPKHQSKNSSINSGNQFRTATSRFWLWEILAYCFSFLCMGAIIAVLAFEDGKQLDQWGI